MQTIPLQAIPRQQFTVTVDSTRFDITLQAVQDCMYATVSRDEVVIVSGVRCVANFQILPSRWMEGLTGNFSFVTNNDEKPWWEVFGVTQTLVYASASELATARGGDAQL